MSHEVISEPPISINTLSLEISWNFRVSRAQSAGQFARDKLLGNSSCAYFAPDIGLRDRFFVIIKGRDCAHQGFTDRKHIASSHCNPAPHSSDPRFKPCSSCIYHAFASLREVREFWNQVFPDKSLEHLPSVCDHHHLSDSEWLVL